MLPGLILIFGNHVIGPGIVLIDKRIELVYHLFSALHFNASKY